MRRQGMVRLQRRSPGWQITFGSKIAACCTLSGQIFSQRVLYLHCKLTVIAEHVPNHLLVCSTFARRRISGGEEILRPCE